MFSAITGDGTVSGLVDDRVFPDVADGSAVAPFVVYSNPSTDGDTTHDGGREIEFPLVQINCYATTKAAAITLANAINSVLDGNTISGTSTTSFQFSNRFGTYESDTKLFGEILEYRAASNTN